MRHEFGSVKEPGVLTPSIPLDIGAQAQRQRILSAMAQSCAEKSFARTTITDIVKRASVSRATFYKHFSNKRECFDAAVASIVAELETAVSDASSSTDTRDASIQASIDAVLSLLATKAAYAKLLLIDAPILDPAILDRHRTLAVEALRRQWTAGKGGRRAGADAEIAFGRAIVLVADRVAAGEAKQLLELRSELVYIALLPFVGHGDALAQAQLAR